ncbi:MAG TPA: cupin domain-containing protein, partial [Burkholderiales bacterium]|nr:cupin domain-containing protein [Burkholderiales bacterium]
LKRSRIESREDELEAFYAQLRSQHVTPAWTAEGTGVEPQSRAVPYVWHWRDLRPQALRAAELVGTEQAERRVLRLTNPELRASASTTLVANIQIVMPGEIARAHRHSASALRLIIEGRGGYTVVNAERIPMQPGDLVLTPAWTWHDHANDTDAPMMWLDGLDTPLVRMLEAGFYEQYERETQAFDERAQPSIAKYGSGGLRPAWEAAPATRYSPLWHYPIAEARAALQHLAADGAGSPFDGTILEYTNPVNGGPVMPTIACYIQMLRPGEHTRAHRHVCCTNYHVIEGSGYSMVGGRRLAWEDKDIFTVPTWTFHEHVNTGNRPAFLFSFTDAPVMKALDLYREEADGRAL